MFPKKFNLRVYLSFLLFIFFLCAFQAGRGAISAEEQVGKAGFDTFQESYYRLLKEFRMPLNPKELIQGAAKGMNVALTQSRISYTVRAPELSEDPDVDLQVFGQIFEKAAATAQDKISSDALMTAALRGMFEATGDLYTVYMTPQEFRSLTEQMNGGDFGGIGIYIELEKGTRQLMVLEPIEDTPAWQAGLKPGDYILEIDGRSTKGITLDEAQQRIRGPVDSKVVLTTGRKGEPDRKVTITRNLIHVKSVSYKMLKGNIGYVRLRIFGEYTGDEVEKAMSDLDQQGAKAYVLDLRNNGGGYIEAAKEVCSKFLPRGDKIVSLRDRSGRTQTDFADGSEHADYPLVVLVNEFSASASEITAGALQDYKRGTILGTRTYGKGSVQTISRLSNGGAVKITIAHYETPSGRDIDKKGITPDMVVPMQGSAFSKSKDVQLDAAVRILEHEASIQQTGMR